MLEVQTNTISYMELQYILKQRNEQVHLNNEHFKLEPGKDAPEVIMAPIRANTVYAKDIINDLTKQEEIWQKPSSVDIYRQAQRVLHRPVIADNAMHATVTIEDEITAERGQAEQLPQLLVEVNPDKIRAKTLAAEKSFYLLVEKNVAAQANIIRLRQQNSLLKASVALQLAEPHPASSRSMIDKLNADALIFSGNPLVEKSSIAKGLLMSMLDPGVIAEIQLEPVPRFIAGLELSKTKARDLEHYRNNIENSARVTKNYNNIMQQEIIIQQDEQQQFAVNAKIKFFRKQARELDLQQLAAAENRVIGDDASMLGQKPLQDALKTYKLIDKLDNN